MYYINWFGFERCGLISYLYSYCILFVFWFIVLLSFFVIFDVLVRKLNVYNVDSDVVGIMCSYVVFLFLGLYCFSVLKIKVFLIFI